MTTYRCLCATLEHDEEFADTNNWEPVRAVWANEAAEKFCRMQAKEGHIKPRQEVLVFHKRATGVLRYVVRQEWKAVLK